MDNTAFDLTGAVEKRWKQLYPDKPVPETYKSWNFAEDYEALYPGLGCRAVENILRNTPDLFDNMICPVDCAVEALNKLKHLGCEVFFCTSPVSNYENCLNQKYNSVKRHFGSEWVNRIILSVDKAVVSGVVLIDDQPKIDGCTLPSWYHIRYKQPYNEGKITWRWILDNTDDFLSRLRILKHLPRDHRLVDDALSVF